LLLAAIKAYGAAGKPETFKSPRWYKRKPAQRASTNDLRNQMRYELWSSALRTNFRPLCSSKGHKENGRKCDLPLETALFSSIK